MSVRRTLHRFGPLAFIMVTIAVVYHGWLTPGVITFGDWGYYSAARMHDFWPIPPIWNGGLGTGLADILSGPTLPLNFLHGLLDKFGVGFALSERLIWIFPAMLAGAFATYFLSKEFFASRMAGIISAFFIVFNSYIAVVMTGGQFTVSSGDLLMPLILLLFCRFLRAPTLKRLLMIALCLAIQVMYDLRTTYITIGVLILFAVCYVLAQRPAELAVRAILRIGGVFATAGMVGILIHAFWLLPGYYAERIALPGGYTSAGWVYTLSYMQLSHAFSVFHPFWYQETFTPHIATPDPLFFLIAVAAFGVFVRRKITFVELFLVSLALVGIFLVKGSNPPGGGIYIWLFSHLPGFQMYREPSKFFQPIALAYALLLGRFATLWPVTGSKDRLRSLSVVARAIVPISCLGLVLYPIVPAFTDTTWGTLAPVTIPPEYIAFQHYIDSQPQFFRTLWIPVPERLAGYSAQHPVLDANSFGHQLLPDQPVTEATATAWMTLRNAKTALQAFAIKYIVIPDQPWDTTAAHRRYTLTAIRRVREAFPTFPEKHIGKIYLFTNQSYTPPIFVPAGTVTRPAARALLARSEAPMLSGVRRRETPGEYPLACRSCLSVASVTSTRYEVIVRHVQHPLLLVLNQVFDPNWAVYLEPSLGPAPFWWTWTHPALSHSDHFTVNGFANAWWITRPGTYRIVVEYWPQRFVDIGFIVCWLTIIGCIAAAIIPSLMGRRRGILLRTTPIVAIQGKPLNREAVGPKIAR